MSHRKSIRKKNVSRFTITRAKVSNKVSHNIHHSLMSAVVGEKSLVILLSMGVHIGLTLGPYVVGSWEDYRWRWRRVRGG